MYSKTEAAYRILKDDGSPMSVKKIIEVALAEKMIQTRGKTPHASLSADLLIENRNKEQRGIKPRFVKVFPSVWALTEWD